MSRRPLDVIGAGLGRTGTLSLKLALEHLGFGPCHHMYEVYEHPEQAEAWIAVSCGSGNWARLFDGYHSTVDWPACTFWRELLAWSPEAKVVLSVRDIDAWYGSFVNTVQRVIEQPRPRLARFADVVVRQRTFGASLERNDVRRAYVAHNRAVIEGVPPTQLLVYDVAEGWPPLCGFLEVAVPAVPFPAANDRSSFAERHSYLT